MTGIQVVGFDLDGTLSKEKFDTVVWDKEIPKLYAQQHSISIAEAKKYCHAAYYRAKHVEDGNEWADIGYWFDRLGLDGDWEQLVKDMRNHVSLYPETVPVLKRLQEQYTLIVVSDAHPRFLRVKLEAERLDRFIDHRYSTHDAGSDRKTPELFEQICGQLGVEPAEMAFIGNDIEDDYEVPAAAGVHSFLLDRDDRVDRQHTVRSLDAFASQLDAIHAGQE